MKPGVKTLPLLVVAGLTIGLSAVLGFLAGCAKAPSRVTALSAGLSSAHIAGLPRAEGERTAAAVAVPAEELWVIARGASSEVAKDTDEPGMGALMAKVADEQVPMPLKHTDVRALVSSYIAAVDVRQQFHNPYSSKIEAVYLFPLPHNAGVNEFIMTIGERRIRGIIRERQEAEQIYQAAKRQGYVASLLTEERPNVFTQSVANIEPGKKIDVNIRYFHTLACVDGWYEFVFPMVVGPRFNPPGMKDGIGAVPRGSTGISGQKTEVQYLRPGERTGHDVSLRVEVDAGVAIEEFACKTHETTHESPAPEKLLVALKSTDSLPNRDFVLRYRVAAERVKTSFLVERGNRGGYFSMMLFPPKELGAVRRNPLELVFVLDCSGSMSGRPIAAAKQAVEHALKRLQPGDSFQLISFSLSASALGRQPLEATEENVQRGLEYLASLQGSGGTMMIKGIEAALDFPHDPSRLRFVCFLTDGYIGNETEILAAIHKRLGPARIFSFGIGSSVNRYLLEHMAKLGRGAVAYLGPRDDAGRIMDDFFERIAHPALTDLQIDWGGLNVTEVFPRELPDLFVGRPVAVTGRFTGERDAVIRVSGKAAGQIVRLTVPATVSDASATHRALPSVWARMKIADLAGQSIYQPDNELPEQIKQIALEYGLMSAFTAFVAVDSSRQTEGAEGTTVPVAVPVPEGVKYRTTVQE